MVAALAVNIPGLPIAREHWAGGRQTAMVAAGAIVNPEHERFDALAAQLRDEKIAETYASLLADRVVLS
jgi:predicted dehydrogenase